MAFLLTILIGLFILIGSFIVITTENNNKFIDFSFSLAFTIMIFLIGTDLLPEIDISNNTLLILLFIFIGFIFTKVIDLLVPEHDSNENLHHIGIMSIFAIVIHNFIESISVYLIALINISKGLIMSLSIGFHNIPLGILIGSTLLKKNNKKDTLIKVLMISLSTMIGPLLIIVFNIKEIDLMVEKIILSITIGMLLFISIVELLPKIIKSQNKKEVIYGFVFGTAISLINYFILH